MTVKSDPVVQISSEKVQKVSNILNFQHEKEWLLNINFSKKHFQLKKITFQIWSKNHCLTETTLSLHKEGLKCYSENRPKIKKKSLASKSILISANFHPKIIIK